MRQAAYRRAIDEAKLLPCKIQAMEDYFNNSPNPKENTIHQILEQARFDKALYPSEFCELLTYARSV